MKKLALVLSFVFCAAIIAPTFATDPPVKKGADKTECAKTCAKEGKACSKEAAACCSKEAKTAEAKAPAKK